MEARTLLRLLAGLALATTVARAANSHFLVRCETTKGPLYIEVSPEWSPIGATRFLDLVQDGFYTNIPFFRSVEGFLTQFGISENPAKAHWHGALIPDDTNLNMGIEKYDVSFAGAGPNSRSTQLFIAFEDLDFLGSEPWETPIGKVVHGFETLDALYKGYEDIHPFGNGPDQQLLYELGNAYIREKYPLTDFIHFCEFEGFLNTKGEEQENESEENGDGWTEDEDEGATEGELESSSEPDTDQSIHSDEDSSISSRESL